MLKIRIILITICLVFGVSPVSAQGKRSNAQNESLKASLQSSLDDLQSTEEKSLFINKKLLNNFYSLRRKTVLEIANKLEKEIDRNESSAIEHIWKLIDAFRYENENKFDRKINTLYECYEYYKTTPKSPHFLQCNYQLGELFFRTGKYESAQRHLREVAESLPGIEHPRKSIVTRKLARNYSNLGQPEIGLDLISNLILQYEKRPNFKWDIKHLRHHMVKALILNKMDRTKEAIELTEISLLKAEEFGNKVLINNCKSGLARYYLKEKELAKAKKFAIEAYEHYEILKLNYPSMTESRMTLGQIYFEEGNYLESKKYFKKALDIAKIHHRLLAESNALNGIINCNLKLGIDTDEIYEQLETYKILRDSLFNTDMANAAQDLEVKYETEKKENYIESLNDQRVLTEKSLREAKWYNLLLGLLMLLLSIAALALYRLYRKRVKSQNLLSEKNKLIEKSLSEKKLLLQEIHHRVKNNLQTVSSLLSLQSNFIEDKKVLDALKDGQNRVQSMALIHQNLYQEDDLKNIMAKSYYEKLISRLYRSYDVDRNKIQLSSDIDDITIDIETIIPLGLITNELISNVFKYAFVDGEKGNLFVALKKYEEKLVLTVEDNGKGLDPSVLNQNNNSFGYQMIKAFCQKLEAKLNVGTDSGTEITITIENYPKNEINSHR